MFLHSGVLFNCDNILGTVKGVEDWWSEEDLVCKGGGLGYWLAVSSVKRNLIQREYADPDVQKQKLIEFWLELDAFASWHRLSRAVKRVGQTQLASLITTYEQPPTGTSLIHSGLHLAVCVRNATYMIVQCSMYNVACYRLFGKVWSILCSSSLISSSYLIQYAIVYLYMIVDVGLR